MGKSRRSGAARKRRQKNWWEVTSVVERNAESMDDGVSYDLLAFLILSTIPPAPNKGLIFEELLISGSRCQGFG